MLKIGSGSTAILAVITTALVGIVEAQTWCGKNYLPDQPIVPPGGSFPQPETSDVPFLAFTCTPRFKPYIAEDAAHPASILIDAPLTFRHVRNAFPMSLHNGHTFDTLSVHIKLEDRSLGRMEIQINTTDNEFFFSLAEVSPQQDPLLITCTATFPSVAQELHAEAPLYYLPNPLSGEVTKLDHWTGALMKRSLLKNSSIYEPVFPIGFFTSFGGYLEKNVSLLDEIKELGFNFVHLVPPFDDVDAFSNVLDCMEELGLFLVYDMRHTYQQPELLSKEVLEIKKRKNLLVWYTADEPDGPGDPLDATASAYDRIGFLDGYHPVSISLNCADYHFTEYVSGCDIVMPDTYHIGNNVKLSEKYRTECNANFGCCGCDNCNGSFEDISVRLDNFRARLRDLAWDRTKMMWFIPQAFGGEEFWSRAPTGREWLVQTLLSINHGARGIMPWLDPTPYDIKAVASILAFSLQNMVKFIFDPSSIFSRMTINRTEIATWEVLSETLVIATSLNDVATHCSLKSGRQILLTRWILNEGVSMAVSEQGLELDFEELGSAIFVYTTTDVPPWKHDEL